MQLINIYRNRQGPLLILTAAAQKRDLQNHGRMNYKDTKLYKSAFLSVDLLTDFAAFCLTDFVDWTLLYLLSDLLPPPPLPSVQYMQTVCDCGGGGC